MMKTRFLLLAFFTTALCTAQEDYRRIHENAIVVDGHNDVLIRAVRGRDISMRNSLGQSDLVRFREGGVDLQFFSVWMGTEYGKGQAFHYANVIIDTLEALCRRNPSLIVRVNSAAEARRVIAGKKIAAAIGVEGGHMIEDRIDYIDSLYVRGMRYMTLVWNSNHWATSSLEEAEHGDSLPHKGLTEFGRDVVRRMNKLGIMIDVSHAGEQTVRDVIQTSIAPVIATHSCVYALAPHYRNLKDDQIRAIAKTGGIVGINFYPGFLDSSYERKSKELHRTFKPAIDSIRAAHRGDHLAQSIIDSVFRPYYTAIRPPLSLLIDHIDYTVKLVGIDFVGIGSDFDGIEILPQELDDASCLPVITRELLKRGYSESDVKKIMGGNFLRVFEAVCR
ncbi:MAG: dipeptidase [Ignavibacteriales bacterium]|nr:dipeptidase [Ignavibacteriales bacterium]